MRTAGVNGVSFDAIEILVLDEADRMMDMGFWPDVRRIVAALPPTDRRHTMLFSATMPAEMMAQAHEITREAKIPPGRRGRRSGHDDHAHGAAGLFVGRKGGVADQVPEADRRSRARLRADEDWRRAAFDAACSRRGSTPRRCTQIGSQPQRTAAIEGFRVGTVSRVLVATDVAARGIDVDGISHVVNFEVPTDLDAYVHRVGRTGRAEMPAGRR